VLSERALVLLVDDDRDGRLRFAEGARPMKTLITQARGGRSA
jgi:hypothetical protein